MSTKQSTVFADTVLHNRGDGAGGAKVSARQCTTRRATRQVLWSGDRHVASCMDMSEQAARVYAERGFYVLPVGPDKQPDTRHGVYDATRDADTLRRWFAGQPGRGLGLAMGGPGRWLALDCDVKHGADGIATYRVLLPTDHEEPVQHTPSGGEHHLWRWPTTVKTVGNGVGFLGPGLDHRGSGGYIVAFPTLGYRWRREPFGPIPELPSRVVDLLTQPKPKPAATGNGSAAVMPPITLESAIGRLATAREGTRNDSLNLSAYLVGRLVAAGKVREADARRMLTETALSIGLTAKETAATIASGLGDGMAATAVMPVGEAIEAAWACLSWGLASSWPGRCGLSDRRVYLAHALICLTCGQEVYEASTRRLAELANLGSAMTALAANERLTGQGLIKCVRLAVRGQFSPSEYQLRTICTNTQGGPGPDPLLGICTICAHPPTTQAHDTFSGKGLGPTAGVVWDSLKADGPATAAQLAARTGRGRRSVEKALRAMTPVVDKATGETYHMLTKTGATYTARADVDLDSVARLLHVDGAGKQRRARHARERERHSWSWQEQRARQRAGTMPEPIPQTSDEVKRKHAAHERLDALRGVIDHTTGEARAGRLALGD